MKVQFNLYEDEEITTSLPCKCVEVIARDFDDVAIYECEPDEITEITKRDKENVYRASHGFKFKDGKETKLQVSIWEVIKN